jgi:quercetin dioxygenase-like cupin family protein
MDIKFHGGDEESGNVFAVETVAEAGYLLESHKHSHSHMSVLVSGTADVTIDGKTERMTGYKLVTIPADTFHRVVAVTDIVWLCLWAGDIAPVEQAKESLKLIKNTDVSCPTCGFDTLNEAA